MGAAHHIIKNAREPTQNGRYTNISAQKTAGVLDVAVNIKKTIELYVACENNKPTMAKDHAEARHCSSWRLALPLMDF